MQITLNCPGVDDPNEGVDGYYPPGTEPEDRRNPISSICSFGHTPRLMTGIVLQILRQHFADAAHVANRFLRGILQRDGTWRAGADTGLYIEALDVWRPELTEKRPAVVVKEGDWKWLRMAIGDQAGYDYRSGAEYYAGYWQGTHSVFAIGREPAETQLLAAEVGKLLLFFGPQIMDWMALHRFVMVKLGALRALQESSENYVAPIDVAYVAEERWKTQQDAPRLKRIVLDLDELLL